MARHRALIKVRLAIHLPLWTKRLRATQTFLTIATGAMHISPAGAIALLEQCDPLADLLDDPCPFVAQSHINVCIVEIGAAEPTVRHSHEHFVWSDVPTRRARDDLVVFAAFKDREFNHRGMCAVEVYYGVSLQFEM